MYTGSLRVIGRIGYFTGTRTFNMLYLLPHLSFNNLETTGTLVVRPGPDAWRRKENVLFKFKKLFRNTKLVTEKKVYVDRD